MPDKKPQWAVRTVYSSLDYIIAWDVEVYISNDRDMDVVFRTPAQFQEMQRLANDPENTFVVANSLYGEDHNLLYVPLNELTDNEFSEQFHDYYIARRELLSLRKLPPGWTPDGDIH